MFLPICNHEVDLFGKLILKKSIFCFQIILGIGKIANTKNSRRKAFKWIVFFMSIGGFLWQTHSFLEIYLDYPVIQHMTTEDPEVISAPAVTLCNRVR